MFVDPKITLSGDRKHAAALIRGARVYLDTQLRQDAAYNRQVSKTRQLLPGGGFIEATHEFGQTYLHIHIPEPQPGQAPVPGEVYGSSGLYLWGIAPDGSYREYLVSHTAPYIFLISINGNQNITSDLRVYTYPSGSEIVAPFTLTFLSTGYYFSWSRLCSWQGKTSVYLPGAYQQAYRNGVNYRLPGYAPFFFGLSCSLNSFLLNTISVNSTSEFPSYPLQWALCVNSAAYLQNSTTESYALTFPDLQYNTAQYMSEWTPDWSSSAQIGTALTLWPYESAQAGPAPSASVPPFNAVTPPDSLNSQRPGNPVFAAQLPVVDGSANLHGLLSGWSPSVTAYAAYADGNRNTLSATASAPILGGLPSSLATEATLDFYSTFVWPDTSGAAATTAAWWGDLLQTNWQYGQLESGVVNVHCLTCKVTAVKPAQPSGLYNMSLQNFTSTITDFFTGGTNTVDAFVLWPMTTDPNDFITVAPASPVTAYTPSGIWPTPPSLGNMSWIYKFRSWSSAPVTPGQTAYPQGSVLYNTNPLTYEWLWDGCPACADASPMGEVFFAASDLSYVVHEPNPALPYPLPILGSSKDSTNTKYDFDITQLFTTLLACIWL